ncbi:M48 family metallopeptidase [Sulfurimonas sp.]|nr:M48 family metallopeptidase [Sulfurimonas sp.]
MTQLITNEIKFNDLTIKHICKKTLKNTYISVDRKGEVLLKSPKVSDDFIYQLIKDKEQWIRKQLALAKQNRPIEVNLEDEVLLFSQKLSIDSDEAKSLRDRLHRMRVPSQKNILKNYDIFYKEFTIEYVSTRVEYYSNLMSLNYKDIVVKKMKSRWGSCSSNKVLTFNSQLAKVDKELIDYVVVHELAHLVHMNHSKKFHTLVDSYLENSQNLRKKLRSIHLV